MAEKKPQTLTPKETKRRNSTGVVGKRTKTIPKATSRNKNGYAAAAVLSADWMGVGGLAKIVGIPGSYVSLIILVALAVLSLLVVYLYWRN